MLLLILVLSSFELVSSSLEDCLIVLLFLLLYLFETSDFLCVYLCSLFLVELDKVLFKSIV